MDRGDEESYIQNKARTEELERRLARVRDLNDRLRTTLTGGRVMLTIGVQALGPVAIMSLLHSIANSGPFTPDNDPYDEHDFGGLDKDGERFFWKIDYYDKQLECGSPDPADEEATARVLTIMRADEY